MKKTNHFLLLFSFLIFVFSCNSNGQEVAVKNVENDLPSRRMLREIFWEKGEVLIIHPNQKKYQEIAEKIKEKAGDRLKIEIKSVETSTAKDFIENITVLFGTPNSNHFIKEILPNLPFQITKNAFQFGEQNFEDSTTIFALPFYPNPQNQQLPLMLVTGLNDSKIIDYLEKNHAKSQRILGWSSWGYEIFKNDRSIIFGNLDSKNWTFDKNVHFDFSAPPDSMPNSAHFEFLKNTEIDKTKAIELTKKCEQTAQKIRNFTGIKKEIPKIKLCLYGSAEEKGLMTKNTDQATANLSDNSVHIVLNKIYADNFIGKENELLLRHLLGKPKTQTLERGLAIFFTENWQRKGYQYWANKLFVSENMLPLSEILNEEFHQKESRYVMGCLAGSFVEFLIQKSGKSDFLKNYLTWQPSKNEIQNLEKDWHKYLSKQSQKFFFKNQNSQIPYLKGFNFAHEGYQIFNGYIGREAVNALEKLKSLHTNSVAIVPYSYMNDPRKPSHIPIVDWPGAENDESVIHAARQAKKMEMNTVLKPQIWIGSDSWPGDIEMSNETDWQLFFENYYRWIRHYAMLAEIHEIEILVLGTEFAKATLQRENDWRELIQKIRKLYSGKITYAANWGEEFEKIAFWEELDFIGLNCYYPLSKNENSTEKELKKGFHNIIQKIESVQKKIGKPLIFTEIGFRSIYHPWLNPHAEPTSNYFGEHQKLCYEIVFEAIENKDWCQGIFWWKFPSYLNYRGRDNASFTPNKKPAEAVVEHWFQKLN